MDRPLDYKNLFAQGLYEELGEALMRHGIDAIREEDLEDIVSEATSKYYIRTIAEFRQLTGQRLIDPSLGRRW